MLFEAKYILIILEFFFCFFFVFFFICNNYNSFIFFKGYFFK